MADDSTATWQSTPDAQQEPHTRAAITSLVSKLLLIARVEREGKVEAVVVGDGACMSPDRSKLAVVTTTAEVEKGDLGSINTQTQNPTAPTRPLSLD